MKDFNYFVPTEVQFGLDSESYLPALVKKYKRDGKVLVLFGGGSVVRSGLLDRIEKQLSESGFEYVKKGGIQPNPRLTVVHEGIDLCHKEGVGLILAVGGGSVVDTAKAIGYGTYYDGDVWDFYIGKAKATDTIPVGVVLTIPAAGSEMSDCTVISNEETQQKLGYSDNLGRAKFAIMNPLLSFTLPDYQTACGAVDIMMHTMERYFTKDTDMLLQTALAEALLRTVKASTDKLLCGKNLSEHDTLVARSAIMWASSLSHNDLMGGRGTSDFATHKMEHEISALYDVAHGAGLAAIWPSWARYVMHEDLSRFVDFATKVMGVMDNGNAEETAEAGIRAMEDCYHRWGMPVGFAELLGEKVSEETILLMADKCSKGDTFHPGYFKSLDKSDIAAIYRLANLPRIESPTD